MKTKKKLTRGKLVKLLDSVYSAYIRLSKSNKGQCNCITCNDSIRWKKIQNGHFVGRSNYNYRWSDENCRPQCMRCNVFYNGNYKAYTLKMIDMFGREKVEFMLNNKKPTDIKTFQLEEMIEYYKNKVNELLKTLDVKRVK